MKYDHFVSSQPPTGSQTLAFLCAIDVNMEMRDPFTEVVNEANRALIVNNLGPIRPLIEFPVSTSGKRTFKFQSRWYDLYSWLEYSVLKDAAFCFYCRCFGTLGKDTSIFLAFKMSGNTVRNY